ncbi:hypothetical protein BZA77DRAFT_289401 [Pyronema omphalodes]|nr:hypothetical protein BZA77DRAFT_289401 [Pyronema omphalodes]
MAVLSKIDPNNLDSSDALGRNTDDPLDCNGDENDDEDDDDEDDDGDDSDVESFDGDDSGTYKPPRVNKPKNPKINNDKASISWPVYNHQEELMNARNRVLEQARLGIQPDLPTPPDFETEQELHLWMLHKFGDVDPKYWKSLEAYYRYGHWFWEYFDEEDDEGYFNNNSLPSMAEADYPDFSLDIKNDMTTAKQEAELRVSKREKKCCDGHAYLWQERNVNRISVISVRNKRRSQIREDVKAKMSPSVQAAVEVLDEKKKTWLQVEEAREKAEREAEKKLLAKRPVPRPGSSDWWWQ